MRETGWLIEYNEPLNGRICWFGRRGTQNLGPTPESIDAIRFSRERDAKDFLEVFWIASVGVTAKEHIWDDGKPDEDLIAIAREATKESEDFFLRRARQNALLQAAATILSGLYGNDEKIAEAVSDAESLLAEIERRQILKQCDSY